MARLKFVVVSLMVIFALMLGSLLLTPSFLITPILNGSLAATGMRITRLAEMRLGLDQTIIASMLLEGNGIEAELSDLVVDYRANELFAGQLIAISAEQLDVRFLSYESETSSEEATSSLEELLQVLESLPFETAAIDSINLIAGEQQFSASLSISAQPVTINAQLQVVEFPDWRVDLSARSETPDYISANLEFSYLLEDIAEATVAMNISGNSVSLDSASGIDLERLKNISPVPELLGPWQVSTSNLLVTSQLLIDDIIQEPALAELVLTIDSDNSLLEFNRRDQIISANAQLNLPVGLRATQSSGGQLLLTLQRLEGELSLAIDESIASISPSLLALKLECELWSLCSIESSLEAQFEAQFDADLGEQLTINAATVDGNLNGSIAAGTLRLLLPQISLSLPEVTTPVGNASAEITLDGMSLVVGDDFASSASFITSSLVPGLTQIELNDPVLYGDIEFRDGKLTVAMNAGVSNQFTTSLLLEHDLNAARGTAAIDLRQYTFSALTPLSRLVTQELVDADIVAGTVAGGAQINWQQNAAGEWDFEGPLNLLLTDISGYYNENLFVDLNTELQARLLGLDGLRSEGILEASIGTIDVGMPIEAVSWQYEFNTVEQQLSLLDLNSSLLGGSASVPELQFNPMSPQSRMTLVLTELDLPTIVGLANYPNVTIDGLISGYLPIVVSSTGISIDEGLVGALNPGGTIRYTPVSSTPSQNSSVQLINDALSNYQYETMNTEVYYDDSGDLRMEVQLQGLNPDMNNGQPINLNVSITDNIPSLLQSLRAGRAITDRLQQQLQRQ